jgi:DNA invertase Pin-like site-specific DNA recombinase
MLIGYARASTPEQKLDLQTDALSAAGCDRLFTDIASGAHAQRPGLAAALEACRPGDTLVVWKLDRLGRSLPHLVQTLATLSARGIGFRSLQESLDTTTPGGKLVFHLFASLAEFERDLIHERTQAGLAAARARGRTGGRPRGVDERKRKAALALKQAAGHSVREICAIVGISRNTYYKYTRADRPASSRRRGPEPPQSPPAPQPRVMKVKLWLRVENNSKYVRGKTKVREEIERHVLGRFGMEKPDRDGGEYILSIPYATDEELDRIIYDEIWRAADRRADGRHCFVEGDTVSLEDPDRHW